jgi:hypothetical protein
MCNNYQTGCGGVYKPNPVNVNGDANWQACLVTIWCLFSMPGLFFWVGLRSWKSIHILPLSALAGCTCMPSCCLWLVDMPLWQPNCLLRHFCLSHIATVACNPWHKCTKQKTWPIHCHYGNGNKVSRVHSLCFVGRRIIKFLFMHRIICLCFVA